MNQDQVVQQNLDARIEGWEEWEGVVVWNGRIYIPVDKKLREDIIREHHDSRLAGHPGQYKTHELITRNYWWPRILRDV